MDQKNSLQELFGQYTWRAAELDDSRRIHVLLLERDQVYALQQTGTLESVKKELQDNWLDLQNNSLIAITPEGKAAAYGMVFVNPEPIKKREAFLWVEVNPIYEDQEMRLALIEWAHGRAQCTLQAQDFDLPMRIAISTFDKIPQNIKAIETLGFKRVRYFYRMRRDLSLPIELPVLPSGLHVVNYSTEWDNALFNAFNEAFADHWNFIPVTKEDWDIWFTGSKDFSPKMSFLVLDKQEIASFSINSFSQERNQMRGINEGWINQLGTRRAWRKQGLATALLLTSMQAFRSAGVDFATLAVDTENTTGALRIYERQGFEPVLRSIAYEIWLEIEK